MLILEKKAYNQLSQGFMVCFNDTCKLLSAVDISKKAVPKRNLELRKGTFHIHGKFSLCK